MKQIIAIDNETHLVSRSRPAPPVVCTSYARPGETPGLVVGRAALRDSWRKILAGEDRIVGHFIAYDMATIGATFPELIPAIFDAYKAGRVHDTMIIQQLYDIACRSLHSDAVRFYSLANLHKAAFGVDLDKGGDTYRLRYAELDGVPAEAWPAEAINYALKDAEATAAIYQAQTESDAYESIRSVGLQTYASFVLYLMTCRGMVTDGERVAEFERRNRETIETLAPELRAAGLLRDDGTKDLNAARREIERACAARGVEPLRTDKGAIAIDKKAVFWSGSDLLKRRGEYQAAEKMLSTYAPFLREGAGGLPVTSSYNLAATGRTTSAGPRRPLVGGNLQNLPRSGGARECFVARPGFYFLAGDFSGAELHALAQTCYELIGRSALGDTLNAGRDVHLFVAAYILGIGYEEAAERYAAGDKDVKGARQKAKAANFGFGGAMGPRAFVMNRLQYGETWTEAEAADLKRIWVQAFPEMVEYWHYCQSMLGPEQETTVTQLYTERKRRVAGLSTLANTYFQGLTADGAKLAICEVVRRCFCDPVSPLYGCRPVNFVHDELILEVPETKDRDAVAGEFRYVMESEFNKVVPRCPTSADIVTMKHWSKEGEAWRPSAK